MTTTEKATQTEESVEKTSQTNEPVKFKGKFIETIGRRKTSVARVRLYKKGNGVIVVNEKKINDFFPAGNANIVKQPLKLTSHLRDVNVSVVVSGGGSKGQAEAVRHGISRSLLQLDEELKLVIKAKGWLSRDSRKKERKKPGLKKARRAPQWSKR